MTTMGNGRFATVGYDEGARYVDAARRMRSEVPAVMFRKAVHGLWRGARLASAMAAKAFDAFTASVRSARLRENATKELALLSDQVLADIGVRRDEIHFLAHDYSRRDAGFLRA